MEAGSGAGARQSNDSCLPLVTMYVWPSIQMHVINDLLSIALLPAALLAASCGLQAGLESRTEMLPAMENFCCFSVLPSQTGLLNIPSATVTMPGVNLKLVCMRMEVL